jgi:phosphatidylserine/phosphatidylglycerophosphate/cardiolipin synthase-like enzyme
MAAGASFLEEDAAPAPVDAAGATFETAFSPAGTLSPLVVKEIASARKSIRVAARQFTSKPVSEALYKVAHSGGMDVKILLSRKSNQNPYSAAQFLITMGFPPHATGDEDSLYADYIVIDDRDVVLGNIAGFADEDEEKKNVASVLVIHNTPVLAKQYLTQWQTLWNASTEMKKEKD